MANNVDMRALGIRMVTLGRDAKAYRNEKRAFELWFAELEFKDRVKLGRLVNQRRTELDVERARIVQERENISVLVKLCTGGSNRDGGVFNGGGGGAIDGPYYRITENVAEAALHLI